MSGVYIPNMEMPKHCYECKFFVKSSSPKRPFVNCMFIGQLGSVFNFACGIPIDCPLIAVPDHGRLIDADAVDYDDYWWNKHYSARDCKQAEKMIEEQPTIIPADKDINVPNKKDGADDV